MLARTTDTWKLWDWRIHVQNRSLMAAKLGLDTEGRTPFILCWLLIHRLGNCLSILITWQLTSPKVNSVRDQSKSLSDFCDSLRMQLCHFCSFWLVIQVNSSKPWKSGDAGTLKATLQAVYHFSWHNPSYFLSGQNGLWAVLWGRGHRTIFKERRKKYQPLIGRSEPFLQTEGSGTNGTRGFRVLGSHPVSPRFISSQSRSQFWDRRPARIINLTFSRVLLFLWLNLRLTSQPFLFFGC